MATYNGGEYLQQQLDSLARQSYKEFRLYVRDDNSTDNTRAILNGYQGLDIQLLSDDLGRLGAGESFLQLLAGVEADVYLFCDQDDVWLPEKVALSMAALGKEGLPADRPLVVHSDLQLVDKNLTDMGASFHGADGVNPRQLVASNRLLIQNCVVGCTMAFNRQARDIALRGVQLPASGIAMHDWWLALCARYFGSVVYIDKPTVLYRQHDNNVSGSSFKKSGVIKKYLNGTALEKFVKGKKKIASQLSTFAAVNGRYLSTVDAELVEYAARALEENRVLALFKLALAGVRFTQVKMNLAILLLASLGR